MRARLGSRVAAQASRLIGADGQARTFAAVCAPRRVAAATGARRRPRGWRAAACAVALALFGPVQTWAESEGRVGETVRPGVDSLVVTCPRTIRAGVLDTIGGWRPLMRRGGLTGVELGLNQRSIQCVFDVDGAAFRTTRGIAPGWRCEADAAKTGFECRRIPEDAPAPAASDADAADMRRDVRLTGEALDRLGGLDLDGCAAACRDNPKCQGWTYFPRSQTCNLFSEINRELTRLGVISGRVR